MSESDRVNGSPGPAHVIFSSRTWVSLQTNLQVCIPSRSILNSSPPAIPFLDVHVVSGDGAAAVECGRLPEQHQRILSHLQYMKPMSRACVIQTKTQKRVKDVWHRNDLWTDD